MRVLHVIPSFGFGGMEKVICSVISHTAERFEHIILPLDGDDTAETWIKGKDVAILHFSKNRNSFKFFRDLCASLKSLEPDLLMTYNWGGTDAIWLGKIAGIKNIVHNEHGFNIDEAKYTSFKRNIIRFLLYHMSSRVIVVSSQLRNSMKNTYLLRENRIHFIPNGINTDCYSPDLNERRRVRQEVGFEERDVVIGFSGRLDPVKNFDFMLDIFSCCTRRDEHFRLLVVGDGSEKSRIETRCRQRNIEENVLLVGQKQNVLPYLRAMDVFLLTSFSEQMPMTILEAMSVGLPVIATRVGEIPQIIQHEKDGLLIELNEKPENVANALMTLKQRQRLASMGKSARHQIISNFQEKAMVQKYRNTLEALIVE